MSYRDDLAIKLETYSGEQMVMLAYDALIENLELGKQMIVEKNMEELDRLLDHNREILAHLNATLGEESNEITDTTRQLYIYINRLMTGGRLKLSHELLEEAIRVLKPLRDGWKELSENLMEKRQHQGNQQEGKGVYAGMTYGKKDINISADSKDWEKG